MSVEKVKFISMSGPLKVLDEVAYLCAQSGVFHSDNSTMFYSSTKSFLPINVNTTYSEYFEKLYAIFSKSNIDVKVEYQSSFSKSTQEITSFIDEFSTKINTLYDKKNLILDKLNSLKQNIKNADHFEHADIDFDRLSECSFVKFCFGKLPLERYERISQNEDKINFIFIVLSQDDEYCYGVYISPVEFVNDTERILSRLYFEPMDISADTDLENDQKQILKLSEDFNIVEKEINDYLNQNKDFALNCYYHLNELIKIEKIKGNGLIQANKFVLTGWIPEIDEQNLTEKLNKIDGVTLSTSPGNKELRFNPPIKLKNGFFSKPFEFYVDMFGLPLYDEIDPTAFVAITYTLLFGIMFGDVGQGIVLSLVGYLMWKLKKMKLGKLLIPCGISSTVFGFVYGSVFGFEHALDPMYKAMGFNGKPIEVMESQTINMIIYAAVGIGVTLVILAMILNVYSSIKKRDFGSALFSPSGLAGIIFYSSLVIGLLLQIFIGIPVFTPLYIICLIVIPLLLMYLQEPLSNLVNGKKHPFPKKWGEYLIQSFFELFEAMLSYVSNTMSFLRVGAFVLVHAGMMMVVAILAGDTVNVTFVLVEIVGNLFVIALEGLLVGIQVLRLEFYEMFSRFYSGSGRPYQPVEIKTIEN